MDYKVIFDNCALLFEYFGWFSILLVIGTTGLMIPLNMLYKKIIKKDCLQRLRKVISALSVYVVALGLIALFTGVVIKAPLTAEYLFASTLPLGVMSQLLWSIIKVIKDYGVAPILKSLSESKEFKNWIKGLGIDKNIVNNIMSGAETYLQGVNATTFEDVVKQELALTQNFRLKLSGFVESKDMDVTIKSMLEKIKSKYPKAEGTSATK